MLGALIMSTLWTVAAVKIYEARIESAIEHQAELEAWGPSEKKRLWP
jgi:hypothetical protein